MRKLCSTASMAKVWLAAAFQWNAGSPGGACTGRRYIADKPSFSDRSDWGWGVSGSSSRAWAQLLPKRTVEKRMIKSNLSVNLNAILFAKVSGCRRSRRAVVRAYLPNPLFDAQDQSARLYSMISPCAGRILDRGPAQWHARNYPKRPARICRVMVYRKTRKAYCHGSGQKTG